MFGNDLETIRKSFGKAYWAAGLFAFLGIVALIQPNPDSSLSPLPYDWFSGFFGIIFLSLTFLVILASISAHTANSIEEFRAWQSRVGVPFLCVIGISMTCVIIFRLIKERNLHDAIYLVILYGLTLYYIRKGGLRNY